MKHMPVTIFPMDEPSAREIIVWSYEAPYDVYNAVSGSTGEQLNYIIEPSNSFYRLVDETENLIAFCSFGLDGRVPIKQTPWI